MEMEFETLVKRNNEISITEIRNMNPTHIIISPGPGRPCDSGISIDIIKELKSEYPILGICLGHQAIGEVFGATIVNAAKICHGKIGIISHDGKGVFKDIPTPFKATRYHSLAIKEDTLPDCLSITARSEDNEIQGIRHKDYNIEGVQFHPESIASENGHKLLRNFIEGNK